MSNETRLTESLLETEVDTLKLAYNINDNYNLPSSDAFDFYYFHKIKGKFTYKTSDLFFKYKICMLTYF